MRRSLFACLTVVCTLAAGGAIPAVTEDSSTPEVSAETADHPYHERHARMPAPYVVPQPEAETAGERPAVSPLGRKGDARVYDRIREVTVLFGGHKRDYLNDTWERRGFEWVLMEPETAPPARYRHTLTYDGTTGAVVLFGGFNGEYLGDTWEWDGHDWIEATPPASPPARFRHATTYDRKRDVVVLFGGHDGEYLGDTWEWDGSAWTEATSTTSPPARLRHSMAYDRKRAVVVLFGGFNGEYLGDTWEWDGVTWTHMRPETIPPARFRHELSYDDERGVVVMTGGFDGTHLTDTWAWDGVDWTQTGPGQAGSSRSPDGCEPLQVGGPAGWASLAPLTVGREGSTGVIIGAKIYVTHGLTAASGATTDAHIYDINANSWSVGSPASIPRTELTGVCIENAAGQGLVFAVGGPPGGPVAIPEIYDPVNDVWSTAAPMPTARRGLGAAFVPGIGVAGGGLGSVYVFGGSDGGAPETGNVIAVNEAYDVALNVWVSKAPLPIPMMDIYSTTYFPNTGRIYVIGGFDGTTRRSTVQIYDPATDTWTAGANMPTPRSNLISGICNDRIYAIGGYDGFNSITVNESYDPVADTWIAGEPAKPNPSSEMASQYIYSGTEIYAVGEGIFGVAGTLHEVFTCETGQGQGLQGTMFATDGGGGNLYTVDQTTGLATLIGFMGHGASPSLAVDPTNGVLYVGGGAGVPNLYTVDPITANSSLVGNAGLGAQGIAGMDFDTGGTLYASVNTAGPGSTGGNTLVTLNKLNGAATVIGPFGVSDIGALAFDPHGVLYGSSGGGTLYTIDTNSGTATAIGSILDGGGAPPSGGGVSGLEFDLDGVLYGGTIGGDLIRISPGSGAFTVVGASGTVPLGSLGVRDLFLDRCRPPLNLFATDGSNGNLLTVDTVTGIATAIGSMGLAAPSLAVDPGTGVLYAGEGNGIGLDNLYTVDPVTATPHFVGNSGLGAWAIAGMDFDSGGTLYASINTNGPGQGGGDVLATLDKNNGAGAIVGVFGPTDISAIAFDAAGTLYGVSSGAGGPPTLYTINIATGGTTAVAQILDRFGAPPVGPVGSLDYDLSGFLYAGTTQGNGDLVRIDPATATFSIVGNSGFQLLASLAFQDICRATCLPPSNLYATDGGGGNLYSIDQITGIAGLIGFMTIPGPTPSLAVDPTTHVMYAGTGGGIDDLYTVNRNTAVATRVGSAGLGAFGIAGMGFNAGGALYASVNTLGPGGTGGDALAVFNKTSAAGTLIGPFGAGIADIAAIVFSDTGVLYGSSGGASGPLTLYTINVGTGAATAVGPIVDRLGNPPPAGVMGLELDLAGVLYGGLRNGDVIRIDPATATFSLVGASGTFNLGALAFEDTCPRLCDSSLDCPDNDVCTLDTCEPVTGFCRNPHVPGTMFATDGGGSNLYTVDQTTGLATLVGNMGLTGLPSIAVDPTNGVLYVGEGATASNLYTVDPITAVPSLVGNAGPAQGLVGMDFNAGGTLYAAINTLGPGAGGGDALATLNKLTAARVLIGAFGAGITDMAGIAFDAAGTLYGASSGAAGPPTLYTIDVLLGTATPVGPIVDPFGNPPPGPGPGPSSLEFDLDGTLYGGTGSGDSLRIDPATAVFTLVGPSGIAPLGGLGVRDECGASCRPPLTLYATDPSAGSLHTVNLVTGAATPLGLLGIPAPSLAMDPGTGVLYAGSGGGTDNLYTVDPVTVAVNLLGPAGGWYAIAGMDFDPVGTLHASINTAGPGQGGGDTLATLDKNTGAGTLAPNPLGPIDMSAIAFDLYGTLYGISSGVTGPATLYTIDTTTGIATPVAQIVDRIGTPPPQRLGGLEYGLSGFLYATSRVTGDVLRIDPANAVFSIVGNAGPPLGSLAFKETCAAVCDPPTTLYGSDGGGGNLYTIDQVTAVAGSIGGMGIQAPSVAFDSATGVFYAGTGSGLDQLYWVDTTTALANPVGFTGLGVWGIVGMNFDVGGNLYASLNSLGPGSGGGDVLARLDKTTGAALVVGPFGPTDISALAFNEADILYGLSSGGAGPSSLYTINLTTGAATVVGVILDRFGVPPVTRVSGLEFDPDGILFGGLANGDVIRIDPATATFATVASSGVPVVAGLALEQSCPRRDCDPSDLSVWGAPGDIRTLRWTDKTTMVWQPPLQPGGTWLVYDTLRSNVATTFAAPIGACLEINDLDMETTDTAIPALGGVLHYVVRAENKCSPGTIGLRTDGSPRPSRICP